VTAKLGKLRSLFTDAMIKTALFFDSNEVVEAKKWARRDTVEKRLYEWKKEANKKVPLPGKMAFKVRGGQDEE
jgi:hypothetical protein